MTFIKTLFTVLFSLLICRAEAQYDPAKIDKKATQLFDQSMTEGRDGNLKEGLELLKKAVALDPRYADAYLSMAGMYTELKNYQAAVDNYKIAKSIDSNYFKDYSLSYSIPLAGLGDFKEALDAVNDFKTIPTLHESSVRAADYRIRSYQFAIDYAEKKNYTDYKFEPHNMGDSVNSAVSEYFPTISLDGKHLVFTRRVHGTNEDFYESDRTDNGWTRARPLAGNINSNNNEGALNISQDGQWLIFTGCNFQNGFGSCDLFISYLNNEGWSAPENLGPNFNTEFWESGPSLSPDKKDLYFTSNRPGGYGGNDIYVCHRTENGHWTAPENLGPHINTAGDESAPFIHADNSSLYFTSNTLPGYGGTDLFIVRKTATGEWGIPENLGYPINTIENEGSLVVAADGKTAYYASDRADSRGQLDLYSFELRNDVRPAKTIWVKGKVYDIKTGKGLPSSVELGDLGNKRIISKLQTDETGNYLTTLPIGNNYAFNVNRKGYLFFSANFNLSNPSADSVYQMDIPLQPIEANASIVLKNIFFDVNQYELKPASQIELDDLIKLLKENPLLFIQINGHTDNVGKPADNLLLSQNRAKAVVNYLKSKGIDPRRLSFKGFGDTQPVGPNSTEAGRARNRRTELKVVKTQ
jgi:outer membrane protein OmpA-like peptidoglycan-associated protein/tetratricopeptide (TPR) repeat protein